MTCLWVGIVDGQFRVMHQRQTVRLLLRQRAAGPRPAIRPVPTVRADLARIAVSAPTLAAYDVLTGGRV